MSEENIQRQRQAYDAWNRGDRETWRALGDPNVEITLPVMQVLEGGEWRGYEAADRLWDAWHETFPDATFHVEEIRDLGDTTYATLRLRGHGARSEVPFDQPIWHVMKWRNSKVIRFDSFLNEAEALKAAGLSE